jgi:hypothetical protein
MLRNIFKSSDKGYKTADGACYLCEVLTDKQKVKEGWHLTLEAALEDKPKAEAKPKAKTKPKAEAAKPEE